MDALLKGESIQLFIIFVFPGLVSMHVYRLLLPARVVDWKNAVLEGMFYSVVNFALWSPIVLPLSWEAFRTNHPVLCGLGLIAAILVTPIIWPCLFVRLLQSDVAKRLIILPYPTAWDWFFATRLPVFMLIHLKSGGVIGGYFGAGSYASSYPNEGDLYIRAVYKLNDNYTFAGPADHTRGLLIRKDEYAFIELFDVPRAPAKEVKV